jgi:prepilin-type N-terminal cleavage/methylation domain-containing protein
MNKKGFTLIELLVVIAIIGMLSGIVLVSMGTARKKARDAKRASDIRTWSTAMTLAYDDSSAACGGSESFPQSASIPSQICPGVGQYLNPAPTSTGVGYDYIWVPNNAACGTTPAGQWYCIQAPLEAETGCWVACEKGTKKLTTACPGAAVCTCGW